MKISVLSFGRKLESFENEWIDVFRKRLSHYTKIEWRRIDDKNDAHEEVLEKELSKKSPGCVVVLLDESGKPKSTKDVKDWIEKLENQSKEEICFVIGGAYGFSKETLKKYPTHLSLSMMTLPHKLALLVLLEQLYRVYSWKAGSPYHHE